MINKRTIQVVSYNPIWLESFKSEAEQLSAFLGENLNQIDHIGSTAVPGLSAKPIIDILISVHCLKALENRYSDFFTLGYKAKGEYGITGRRYFQKGGNQRTHHLHIFQKADEHLIRHIAFRDYLIANSDIASKYQKIKLAAAQLCKNDNKQYQELKNQFIQYHQKKALEVF